MSHSHLFKKSPEFITPAMQHVIDTNITEYASLDYNRTKFDDYVLNGDDPNCLLNYFYRHDELAPGVILRSLFYPAQKAAEHVHRDVCHITYPVAMVLDGVIHLEKFGSKTIKGAYNNKPQLHSFKALSRDRYHFTIFTFPATPEYFAWLESNAKRRKEVYA